MSLILSAPYVIYLHNACFSGSVKIKYYLDDITKPNIHLLNRHFLGNRERLTGKRVKAEFGEREVICLWGEVCD